MAQEPYLKGTICEVKGTKKEVKILGQVKPTSAASGPKQKGFVYEVEHLSQSEKDTKTKYSSIELQARPSGFRK
jgi:hypothetical protein